MRNSMETRYPIEKHGGSSSSMVPSEPVSGYSSNYDRPTTKWNPKTWSKKSIGIVVGVVVVVVVAIIVGAVLGVRANAYPDYSKINYKLQDTYSGSDFFSKFDYFTGYDPAHGFVHYVDAEGSAAQNLTYVNTSNKTAVLRVDTTDKSATTGRRSVRISSKQTYNSGLFIFDIVHSPYGCATWPALWLVDQGNWPRNGEIDVMEAVGMASSGNQMTLHTSKGCKIGKNRKRKETGTAISYDCLNQTNGNEGCGVKGATATYGEEFNKNGGGIYAMEWRNEGIRVWFFTRNNLPNDLSKSVSTSNPTAPDPSTWPTALADFPNLECDISSHFKNQSITANIDLCGDWAGQQSVFAADAQCTGTCSDWVANQASSFGTAFWEWNGWWVWTAA